MDDEDDDEEVDVDGVYTVVSTSSVDVTIDGSVVSDELCWWEC